MQPEPERLFTHAPGSRHMVSRIKFELTVPAEAREDVDHFVSFCPALDISNQGPSEQAALDNLTEALQLFVESCLALGTLDRVLKDCGFEPEAAEPEPVDDRYDRYMIHVPLSLVAHELARSG